MALAVQFGVVSFTHGAAVCLGTKENLEETRGAGRCPIHTTVATFLFLVAMNKQFVIDQAKVLRV